MKTILLILFLVTIAYSSTRVEVSKYKTPQLWSYFLKDVGVEQENYVIDYDVKGEIYFLNIPMPFYFDFYILNPDIQKILISIAKK